MDAHNQDHPSSLLRRQIAAPRWLAKLDPALILLCCLFALFSCAYAVWPGSTGLAPAWTRMRPAMFPAMPPMTWTIVALTLVATGIALWRWRKTSFLNVLPIHLASLYIARLPRGLSDDFTPQDAADLGVFAVFAILGPIAALVLLLSDLRRAKETPISAP